VDDDTEDLSHACAEIVGYEPFSTPVDFFKGPSGASWEPAKTMRNSARRIPAELYRGLLSAGGLSASEAVASPDRLPLTAALQVELASYPGPGKRPPYVLRRIQRILETYERPSTVTNEVKRVRGDGCQLCERPEFLKRDGRRCSEVHHLFHLAADPPEGSLEPEYLVVLCETCHRRMHYALVGIRERLKGAGWLRSTPGMYFSKLNSHRR
jgi:hypothetical protein